MFANQGVLPVSTTPVAMLPSVSGTPAAIFATGTPGVVDTCGKFASSVNDIRGAPRAAILSVNLKKNSQVHDGILKKLGKTDS